MHVICSQMDFTHCRSLTFSKLSVGKEYISKPFFFFLATACMMNLPDDSSLHQHPAFSGCSSLHSQLRQWRGGEENNGRFGWTSEERGGTGGLGRKNGSV